MSNVLAGIKKSHTQQEITAEVRSATIHTNNVLFSRSLFLALRTTEKPRPKTDLRRRQPLPLQPLFNSSSVLFWANRKDSFLASDFSEDKLREMSQSRDSGR